MNFLASPEPVSVTRTLTYNVLLGNTGPQDATNVVLTDNLQGTLSFGSANIVGGSCTEAQQVVVCNIAKLVSGDTAIATITMTPTATGSITSVANVSANEHDPDPSNNSLNHSTHVDPMFNLTITVSGGGTGKVMIGNTACSQTCKASFPTQTVVLAQVQPGLNSGFGGWGGACMQEFNAPGCDVTMTGDQTVIAEFDPLPNFTFALEFQGMTVQQGKSDTQGIELVAEGSSFHSAITLSCSVQGASPAPTCSLSPNSITIPDNNPVASNLTITTTAPHQLASAPRNEIPTDFALALPFICAALIRGSRRKSKSTSRSVACVLTICGAAILQISCGGGGNNTRTQLVGGTQPGNYTVIVTGTSGSIQHTVSIPVVVQ